MGYRLPKTNSSRPVPLSMNDFLHELEFVYKYFVIQNIEILGIKPKL